MWISFWWFLITGSLNTFLLNINSLVGPFVFLLIEDVGPLQLLHPDDNGRRSSYSRPTKYGSSRSGLSNIGTVTSLVKRAIPLTLS